MSHDYHPVAHFFLAVTCLIISFLYYFGLKMIIFFIN
nr:MAG TPA: hypothetical protein [Caudoviricetes sp.]DAN93609.1 MAG TPA: hypothetical protein [Caudoviricetes sp.]